MSIPLWLQHAIDTFGYVAIFVAVALETIGIPFPGETALLAGAIYAGGTAETGQLNIVGVVIAGALGAIMGDNIGYTIGYYGGHPLIIRLLHLFHIPRMGLTYTEWFFRRHGDKTVLLGRFVSLLRIFTALLAGVSRMPRRTFFFWNATGGILWALCYGLIGYFLGRNLDLLDRVLKVMGVGGVVALVVAVVVVVVLVRRGLLMRWLASMEAADARPVDARPADARPADAVDETRGGANGSAPEHAGGAESHGDEGNP